MGPPDVRRRPDDWYYAVHHKLGAAFPISGKSRVVTGRAIHHRARDYCIRNGTQVTPRASRPGGGLPHDDPARSPGWW